MELMTDDAKEYMEYLDEIHGEDYGRLLFLGDPIQFSVGMNDWLREKENAEFNHDVMVGDAWECMNDIEDHRREE